MPKKYKFDSTLNYRLPNGDIKRVHVRADTKKEFDAKKLKLKEQEKRGIDLTQNTTFGYWAMQWLEQTKLNQGLSKGTEDCYKASVKMLVDKFKATEFRQLTMNVFQCFINDLSRCNPNTGQPMSARYLRLIKSTAKDISLYASGCHVDGVSAFYNVSIPHDARKKEVTALTEEQINMIVSTPDEMQLFAMIGLFSGLRRGEILALQWKHIDLEKPCIRMEQSIAYNNNEPVIKPGGKTVNATRTVYIPPVLKRYLLDYKNNLDVYPAPNAFVCANKDGNPYTLAEFRNRWHKYNMRLNLDFGGFDFVPANQNIEKLPMKIDPIDTHQLRHTFATLCYLEDLSVADTMQLLGHSTPNVTIGIYTDLENYNRLELSEDFKQKLMTVYRIPLAEERNKVQKALISY